MTNCTIYYVGNYLDGNGSSYILYIFRQFQTAGTVGHTYTYTARAVQ